MFDWKWSQCKWFALCITVVIAVVTPDTSGLEKASRAPQRTEWDLSPLAETVCEEAVWSQLIHESELWRAHSIFSGHQNLHDTNDINPTASRQSSEHVACFSMHILNYLISVTMISLACVQLNSSISKQLTMYSGHGFTSLCGKGGWARKLAKRTFCSRAGSAMRIQICVFLRCPRQILSEDFFYVRETMWICTHYNSIILNFLFFKTRYLMGLEQIILHIVNK